MFKNIGGEEFMDTIIQNALKRKNVEDSPMERFKLQNSSGQTHQNIDYFKQAEEEFGFSVKDLLSPKEIAEELFENEYEKSLNQWLIQHYKTQKRSAEFTNYQSIIDILKE